MLKFYIFLFFFLINYKTYSQVQKTLPWNNRNSSIDPTEEYYAISKGILYFKHYNGSFWRTDGGPQGTYEVKNIILLEPFHECFTSNIVAVGEKVFFQTCNQLWSSDGTTEGTIKLIRKTGQGRINTPINVDGIYCYFEIPDSAYYRPFIVRTDGTKEGTKIYKNVFTDSIRYNIETLFYQKGVYFVEGYSYKKQKYIIKSTKLTVESTFTIAEVDGLLNNFILLDDKAIFSVFNIGSSIVQILKTDGTKEGTQVIKEFKNQGRDIKIQKAGNSVLVNIPKVDASHRDDMYYKPLEHEVWKSDGTKEGFHLLKTYYGINPPKIYNGTNSTFISYSNIVNQLWAYDHSAQKLSLVKESKNKLGNFCFFKDELVFTETDSVNTSIFKTKGTQENPVPYVVIAGAPGNFYPSNDVIFFWFNDGYHGMEPWKSDGTKSGTRLLKDINCGPLNSQFGYINIAFNNKFVFHAKDDLGNLSLWSSTEIVTDIAHSIANENRDFIYPIPASNYINLPSKYANTKSIRILNMTGQEMANYKDPLTKINLENFSSGLYNIIFELDDSICVEKIQVLK